MSTLTAARVVPDHVQTTLPIAMEVGETVAAVIRMITGAWEVKAHLAGLDEAARVVTDELVEHAGVWAILELSVQRDDFNIYVRLSTDVVAGTEPTLTRTTRASIAPATGSHHVAVDGTRLLIVLEAALR